MPHIWNDILVVTKNELVPEFYTANNLSVTLTRYKDKDYGPKRAQLGGHGRELLVVFDSLPKKYQNAIGDPRKTEHILDNYYKISQETVKFYTDYRFPDGEYLSTDAQDKHITNASILQACIQLSTERRAERLNKGGSIRGINKTIWSDAMSFIELKEKKNPDTFHCSLPRSYRKFMDDAFKPFKKEGCAAIVKKYKSNTNAKKVRKSKEEKLFNDLFSAQESKPNYKDVAKQYESFLAGYLQVVSTKTGEVYSPEGFRAVSDSTVANYLKKWENAIGNEAKRSGDRQKLITKFSPYHSFERPKFAGSLYSIDDRQPPFEYEKGKRMWFYNGIDLASECFTCFVHGKSKEGIILDFYRQLVRNYHEWGFALPDGLECESSLNSSFTDSFLRDGYMFQDVRIEANNARGKKIERYFGELRYGIEKKREGWIARPFAKSEANQAGPTPKQIIPYDTLTQQCLEDLQTWNNMPHSKHPEMTRWEYFCEMQHKDLKPTNYRAFLLHLGYKTETSCNAGIIKLQYSEFLIGDQGAIASGENLIRLMKKIEGRQIDVYWLNDNHGEIFKAFAYIGNQYICEVMPKPRPNRARLERTPKQKIDMQLMSAYRLTIDTYQRDQKNNLEPVAIINEKPKTLNNGFQLPGQRKAADKPQPKETEFFDEDEDNGLEYQPTEHKAGSWRNAFN